MTVGLAENAAALAGRAPDPVEDVDHTHDYTEPDLDHLDLAADPEKIDVITAWLRLMGDVRVIKKNQQFKGGNTKFMFRGVDAVLNAYGPICRAHGVVIMPICTTAEYRDIPTSSGGKMRECTATVTFRIYGPAGDHFDAQTMGEATDSGSRSTPKAQSVALRTLMLNGGMVPTEDRDADADDFERGEAPARTAESYRDEMLDPKTTPARLQTMYGEMERLRILRVLVVNETGDKELLVDIGNRLYYERGGK
ncbi:ERF family protein [Embleya sp. NPDC020630]|uniref:ERF family protein n=1 Tax=Embleya sp. NPDC020630 TaxID=3363979 RepID=UPI003790986A